MAIVNIRRLPEEGDGSAHRVLHSRKNAARHFG